MGLGELSCIWDEKYQQILNLKFQFIFLSCIKKKFKCSLPGAWAVTLCSCQGPRFTSVPQTGRRGKGKDLEKVHWGHLSRKENNYTDSFQIFPVDSPLIRQSRKVRVSHLLGGAMASSRGDWETGYLRPCLS